MPLHPVEAIAMAACAGAALGWGSAAADERGAAWDHARAHALLAVGSATFAAVALGVDGRPTDGVAAAPIWAMLLGVGTLLGVACTLASGASASRGRQLQAAAAVVGAVACGPAAVTEAWSAVGSLVLLAVVLAVASRSPRARRRIPAGDDSRA